MNHKFKPTDCPVEHRWCTAFKSELSRYGAINIYVEPITRKMLVRQSVSIHAKRLPPGAVMVGYYESPHPVSMFIDDMRAVMQGFGVVA